jgi:hypothetical protein
MCFVAIIALMSFGVVMLRRSAAFSTRAEQHRLQLLEDTLNAGASTRYSFQLRQRPTPEEEADRRYFLRRAEVQKRLYEKYRHAARFPWLPVEPDAS